MATGDASSRLSVTVVGCSGSDQGVSHGPKEWTEPEELLAGAEVLLDTVLELDVVRSRASP